LERPVQAPTCKPLHAGIVDGTLVTAVLELLTALLDVVRRLLELLEELLEELLLEELTCVLLIVAALVELVAIELLEGVVPYSQTAPRWQVPERPALIHLHCRCPVELGW
jgi:hypothetical protein